MATKVCFKCGIDKSLLEYYAHPKMRDGYLGKCISCTKNDVKKRESILSKNPEWKEKEMARHREKTIRLNYKEKYKPTTESKKESIRKFNERFPEKKIIRGLSSRLKASIKGNHLHHWSYNIEHAKDTIELSLIDHTTIHRFIIYDQERKMYRTTENILLDTKERHVEYISLILLKNK